MTYKQVFYKEMQRRIAQTSIGPSSLRNQGKGGIIETCRKFCEHLPLSKYNVNNFEEQLDKDTRKLLRKLKISQNHWGTARKALNLFLRDAFYNVYLSKKYKLYKIESLLEIPLDKDVAGKINARLPVQKWNSNELPRSKLRGIQDQNNRICCLCSCLYSNP